MVVSKKPISPKYLIHLITLNFDRLIVGPLIKSLIWLNNVFLCNQCAHKLIVSLKSIYLQVIFTLSIVRAQLTNKFFM
jgi:hypothetical protein